MINVESKVGVVSRDEKRHESDVKRETYRREGWREVNLPEYSFTVGVGIGDPGGRLKGQG